MNGARAANAPAWPLLLSLLASLLLAAIIGHALMRMPVPFNDNFSEIADTYRKSLGGSLARKFADPGAYFRPFEIVWRYLISYGFGQGIFGYNLFAAIWLALVAVTFALVCRPENGRDLASFLVALAVLMGHHATQAAWGLNIVISNGVVLAVGIISIGLIGRPATLAGQLCAVLLTAVCLLTKEVGLVVAGIFVAACLLQMPGVRRTTAIVITLVSLAYLGFHFYTLPALAMGNPQKATNVIDCLSNVVATFVMFWIGAPTDGVWASSTRFIAEPWQWVQFAAGPVTLLLLICGWLLAPSPAERERYDDAPSLDRRWFVLFGAALLGCCALGFYYTRHRHGAPAVPLLAYCTYLSMRVLLWRLDRIEPSSTVRRSPLLAIMALAGLACALIWPLRVVTGFEYARALSGSIQSNWHNKMQHFWGDAGIEHQPFLVPFVESVDLVPWARRQVPILGLLGKRPHKSVNR
jgi:hypothetical protein